MTEPGEPSLTEFLAAESKRPWYTKLTQTTWIPDTPESPFFDAPRGEAPEQWTRPPPAEKQFVCMFCWQPRTGPGACERCGPILSRVLTDPAALPSEIHKVSAWVQIPREMLCDQIGHVHDESCPPPAPRFVPSRRFRFGVWRRRQVRRVRRLAHRDRIDQDRDD